ncbi:MAG: TolC family protein [Vicinamibacteria bacterium]|jgi:outer membrane protein TolC|nr:TolC family protein [Vicinamibacteria bacterium]
MRKLSMWGLLALTSAMPVHAGDVTEEQFLAAAGENHAAIRALGGELAQAESERRRAGTLANPRLEFWREEPDAVSTLTNWTVAWTPPLDGRFGLGKQAADASVAAAREELKLGQAEVRREMRRAFAEWSVAHARAAVLSRRLERITKLATQERHRARVGAESGLSARRLGLAEAEARADLREAEAGRARAVAAVRAWHPELAADAVPLLPPLAPPPVEAAVGTSPAVTAAERRSEQAQLAQRLGGRFWGFPTLTAGVQRIEEAGVVRTAPLFAASWSLPLFDRNQATRAEAQVQAEIAAARLAQTRALNRAGIEGGVGAYTSLLTAVEEAAAAAADVERVIDAASAAYGAGEQSLTDLLDALGAAFQARLRELDLKAQALAAHREIEAALGRALTAGGVR